MQLSSRDLNCKIILCIYCGAQRLVPLLSFIRELSLLVVLATFLNPILLQVSIKLIQNVRYERQ